MTDKNVVLNEGNVVRILHDVTGHPPDGSGNHLSFQIKNGTLCRVTKVQEHETTEIQVLTTGQITRFFVSRNGWAGTKHWLEKL